MTASISLAGTGDVAPVALAPVFSPLKQAAIDQRLKPVLARWIARRVDQMFGTGNRARGAQKLDVGQNSSQMRDHITIRPIFLRWEP